LAFGQNNKDLAKLNLDNKVDINKFLLEQKCDFNWKESMLQKTADKPLKNKKQHKSFEL
jgi:hypothetical protein